MAIAACVAKVSTSATWSGVNNSRLAAPEEEGAIRASPSRISGTASTARMPPFVAFSRAAGYSVSSSGTTSA